MSAPNTDPERQVKRHRGPLFGMAFAGLAALLAFALLILWLSSEPEEETLEDPQILSAPGATLPEE
ncbi:MAG: hypothetical protein NXH97_05610 [Rhodobacteraceae bacterium]|nr:hypothetical protein [Paracoccaceae bacterium]